MTYRLRTDNEKYMIFHIEPKELRSKMGDDITIHLGAAPKTYTEHWVKPDAVFCITDEYKNANKIPDITLWGQHLILNQKAYLHLSSLLNEYGEFLQVNCEGKNYYIFNILKNAEEINAVDTKNSKKNIIDGVFMGLSKLVFKEDILQDTLIFKTAYDNQKTFCNEEFKKIIVNENLHGLLFKTDLEGFI